MNKNFIKLVVSILGCELVALLAAPFTIAAVPDWYANLFKPSFAPPNWIFAPAWTLLYFLMGLAFYLIWRKGLRKKKIKNALLFFLLQLLLNFIWSPVFFGLRSPQLGLMVIIALWFSILVVIRKFYPLSKLASYLLLPYLLWVSFAGILNFAIVILN